MNSMAVEWFWIDPLGKIILAVIIWYLSKAIPKFKFKRRLTSAIVSALVLTASLEFFGLAEPNDLKIAVISGFFGAFLREKLEK